MGGDAESKVTKYVESKYGVNMDSTLDTKIDNICNAQVDAGQVVRMEGLVNVRDVEVKQTNEARNTCKITQTLDFLLKAGLSLENVNDIMTEASAQGGSMLGGDAKSEIDETIITDIETNLSHEVSTNILNECILNTYASQLVEFKDWVNVSGVKVEQTNSAISECYLGTAIAAASEQGVTLKSMTKSKTSASAIGGSLINPMASMASSGSCVVVVIVLAIAGVVIMPMVKDMQQ